MAEVGVAILLGDQRTFEQSSKLSEPRIIGENTSMMIMMMSMMIMMKSSHSLGPYYGQILVPKLTCHSVFTLSLRGR